MTNTKVACRLHPSLVVAFLKPFLEHMKHVHPQIDQQLKYTSISTLVKCFINSNVQNIFNSISKTNHINILEYYNQVKTSRISNNTHCLPRLCTISISPRGPIGSSTGGKHPRPRSNVISIDPQKLRQTFPRETNILIIIRLIYNSQHSRIHKDKRLIVLALTMNVMNPNFNKNSPVQTLT